MRDFKRSEQSANKRLFNMSAKPSDDVQTSFRWVSGAKVQQKSHSCKRNAIFIIERSIFSLVNASVALLFRVRTWEKDSGKCGAHYHTIT